MYKLLIVDDELMIREGLEFCVRKKWKEEIIKVHTAKDGEEAWEMAEKETPDLLITDIRMPRMSGIELLRKIRDKKMQVKAIALSGYDDFEYVRDMALLGIENYLLKPVNEEELISTISSTLEKITGEKALKLKDELDANLIRENIINRWIYGSIGERELMERSEFLRLDLEVEGYLPCAIRLLQTQKERNAEVLQRMYELCRAILKACQDCYFSRSHEGDVIAVFCGEDGGVKSAELLNACMESIYGETGQKAYVLIGSRVGNYWDVAESFRYAITNGVHIDHVKVKGGKEGGEEIKEDESTSPFSILLAQYIMEHYQEELSLKSLAVHFKGNAAYIGQVFKRDMHQSFSDYLKDVRIEKAKELLLRSELSTKEVGRRVGFANTTYFCTVFKNETGLSPDRYRKKVKH